MLWAEQPFRGAHVAAIGVGLRCRGLEPSWRRRVPQAQGQLAQEQGQQGSLLLLVVVVDGAGHRPMRGAAVWRAGQQATPQELLLLLPGSSSSGGGSLLLLGEGRCRHKWDTKSVRCA